MHAAFLVHRNIFPRYEAFFVEVIAALVGDVRLLLLDEPTNGLDADGVRMLAEVLRDHAGRGGLSVVATHDDGFATLMRARRLRLVAGRVG